MMIYRCLKVPRQVKKLLPYHLFLRRLSPQTYLRYLAHRLCQPLFHFPRLHPASLLRPHLSHIRYLHRPHLAFIQEQPRLFHRHRHRRRASRRNKPSSRAFHYPRMLTP